MSVDRLLHKDLYGLLHQGQHAAGGKKQKTKQFKDPFETTLKRCPVIASQVEDHASCHTIRRSCCATGIEKLEHQCTQNCVIKQAKNKLWKGCPNLHQTQYTHVLSATAAVLPEFAYIAILSLK